MPKNIEMSVMGSSGSYEVLYPKSVSDIILSSNYLNGMFNLSANSDIDDAFDYINRKIILLQYDKAGINVTLKSAGGSPLEGIPINGITANYDGTGSCVTDGDGKCFGYCNAGNVTLSTNKYVDMTVNSQQLNVLASEMYNTELTASNFVNFKKWTSTTNNIRFSNNVSRVDVTCVGGGGGGGYAYGKYQSSRSYLGTGGGGAGGNVIITEDVAFNIETIYQAVIGGGGQGSTNFEENGEMGGTSQFLSVQATGGNGGYAATEDSVMNRSSGGAGGVGNGNGGSGLYVQNNRDENGNPGTVGTVLGYSSFTESIYYGGGGGSGATGSYNDGGLGGGYGGNGGGTNMRRGLAGEKGQNGFGGGGGSSGAFFYNGGADDRRVETENAGSGGSGCVAIRMHLKVAS